MKRDIHTKPNNCKSAEALNPERKNDEGVSGERSSNKLVIEKLRGALARREKRLSNDRIVYGYKVYGSTVLTDNLILLPKATQDGHIEFLRRQMSSIIDLNKPRQSYQFEIFRLGEFNVGTFKFFHKSIVKVIDVGEVYDILFKLSKGVNK